MSEVNDMPTDQELFQQALKALEIECRGYNDKVVRNQSLIAALRERLAQPERQPLTDARIDELWCEYPSDEFGFARAIEAAHGIGDL